MGASDLLDRRVKSQDDGLVSILVQILETRRRAKKKSDREYGLELREIQFEDPRGSIALKLTRRTTGGMYGSIR